MSEKKLPKGIKQKKDGRYEAKFQYLGEIYYVSGRDLKKVKKEFSDLRYEVEHGLKDKGDDMSLNSWNKTWLEDYKSNVIKDSTKIRYQDFYRRYIKKKLGSRKLSEIKPMILQKFFNEMAKEDYSTKTIKDTYNIIYNMFKIALQNELVLRNPCEGVTLPKTKAKEKRVLTVEEQKEVLKYSKGFLCEQLIRVALGTGMRAGELLGLKWKDIDFENREINIDKTLVYIKDYENNHYYFKYQTPKTKAGTRVIPMQHDVYNALMEQRANIRELKAHTKNWQTLQGFENMVFVNVSGRPRQVIDFRNDLLRLERRINKDRKEKAKANNTPVELIQHFYPHSLRHTFATRCFEAGIEAKTVQNYLGHSSIAITMDLYTHVTEDKAKEEMNKLEELYRNII